MGAVLLSEVALDDKYEQMREYLSSEGGYWLKEDKWYSGTEAFTNAGLKTRRKNALLADFTTFSSEKLRTEIKYYYLYSMKNGYYSATSLYSNYSVAVRELGPAAKARGMESFSECNLIEVPDLCKNTEKCYVRLYRAVTEFIEDYYDDRPETEKDIWHASRLPGVRQSAAERSTRHTISFREIPEYYRGMVKRFMSRLIVRRSWSYSTEMLMYIRYFFRKFYENGYGNGFFQNLSRADVERYLGWVAEDYADKNATFRSKAVSFIRQFIDYIQLSEYEGAPEKDITKLILDDDYPRRERSEDTMNKVKYIPAPVREQLDAAISELEPEEMRPVYVLLRESGWRGTDVLNLRYDSCLDYLWSNREGKYIPYLCGEITKTGIPVLKIPLRQEVADMVKKLADNAKEHSTDENNPDHYLFNIYSGRNMGKPYSKAKFSMAVQKLIDQKGILDGDGTPYHFKAHSLRHTRAMEYTEQGIPIAIIQQMLGHCSLQMTLHYAKVSENTLYEKWKETEKLDLLRLDVKHPAGTDTKTEGLRYEYVRKNLEAVKVPFGICFSPAKLSCRQQMNPCLKCANFCSCSDNIPEYEAEIARLEELMAKAREIGRTDWEEKNRARLEKLREMLSRIREEGIVHKNGKLREDNNAR